MPRDDYEDRRQSRIDRLHGRADKAQDNSGALLDEAREMASVIPFGQPILVGHHSEKRDRNYRSRITGKFDKAFQENKKADGLRQRASAAEGNTAISSDDPEAVIKLKEKIAEAEERQAMMKAVNRIVRRKPKNEPTAQKLKDIAVKMNTSEDLAAKLFEPDFCGRLGFADYQLTNNNANIRRMKQRLVSLEREFQAVHKATEHDGFKLVENVDENRVQFIFDEKPSPEVRQILKRNGFRWAPSCEAWQRMLNNAGRNAADYVVRQLGQ